MNYTFAQYQESADYIRSQIGGFAPKVAMILGSGLGYMGAATLSAKIFVQFATPPLILPNPAIYRFVTPCAAFPAGQTPNGRTSVSIP